MDLVLVDAEVVRVSADGVDLCPVPGNLLVVAVAVPHMVCRILVLEFGQSLW